MLKDKDKNLTTKTQRAQSFTKKIQKHAV